MALAEYRDRVNDQPVVAFQWRGFNEAKARELLGAVPFEVTGYRELRIAQLRVPCNAWVVRYPNSTVMSVPNTGDFNKRFEPTKAAKA